MTKVTTHVLDTASGLPAVGIVVVLSAQEPASWKPVGDPVRTDADGRVNSFPYVGRGVHRLTFETDTPFFPEVAVTFNISDEEHLHVPLLLSAYGYSVYRGS